MSINKVILVGNVGKDPVVRYFDKGTAKASFPLATSETYTNQQGETITNTEWHNIVLWRALAEVAEKTVKKGSQVYIVGKIKTRSYVDKDGNNKYITEILADTMIVLDKKQGAFLGQTEGKNDDYQVNANPFSETSEPKTTYHPSGDNNNDALSGKMRSTNNLDSEQGGTFSSEMGTGQNEDDLPF